MPPGRAIVREASSLGARVRYLRRREGLSQVHLAERLGISPSYLNLIEHNRRPLSAALLIRLAQLFNLDLHSLSPDVEARLTSDLLEVFGDPLFEEHDITAAEVKDFVSASPVVARAVLALHQAYRSVHESADTLAMRLSDGDETGGGDRWRLPNEEVNDLIQRHGNYFADLEAGADRIWQRAGLSTATLYEGMVQYLRDEERVEVRIETVNAMRGALRRYDPDRRVLRLSEVLRRGSRNFHVAHQIGLLTERAVLDRIAGDPLLSANATGLARVALANYFAAALLMPYQPFLEAARAERYDIQVLGNRFRTSFEQVCQRFTTLRRPGAEGVPFHFVRIDVAGNISKRFSASGFRFARFSGACPRWNVFAAFLTPGMIRTQLSQMPDGAVSFWVARTIHKPGSGYHSPYTLFAVAIGCDVKHARELVYADGVDVESREAVVPVGITCRLCERIDCEQRAFPPLHHPLTIDEHVRGVSFYVAPK
jgi:predicted transcriptional regulator/transcriptional regulator with XRE-family HTH domain